MSKFSSKNIFNTRASNPPKSPKKKPPPPLSLRLTEEERARLEKDAAGISISAYIREKLFGDDVEPRKTRGQFPVKDRQALAKILGRFAYFDIFTTTRAILDSAAAGKVHLHPQLETELVDACLNISLMRRDLISALGIKAE